MIYIIAMVIIIIIVMIYFFVFPGLFLVRSWDLKGYWVDLYGSVYKFHPVKNKLISFQITNGDNISYGKIIGSIFKSRVTIYSSDMIKIKNGYYNPKTKTINFTDGGEYTKILYKNN